MSTFNYLTILKILVKNMYVSNWIAFNKDCNNFYPRYKTVTLISLFWNSVQYNKLVTDYKGNTWFVGPSDRNVAQGQRPMAKFLPVCPTIYM